MSATSQARRESAASIGQVASRANSGKPVVLTLESLLSASKDDLTAQLASRPQRTPQLKPVSLQTLQLQILREAKVDVSVSISALASASQCSSLTDHLESLVQKIQVQKGLVEEASRQCEAQALSLQQKHAAVELRSVASAAVEANLREDMRSQIDELKQITDSLSPKTAQDDTRSAAAYTLRLTGLQESVAETAEELLERVSKLLEVLPKPVSPISASRQGRSVRNRPVIITFATMQDRATVLRTKSVFSKHETTKPLSINAELTVAEQKHKNALWPAFQQAKRENRRAFFKGCHLWVDGQLVPGPLQVGPSWDLQHPLMPGHVSDQAFPPMSAATFSPSFFSNPLAYASQPSAQLPHQPTGLQAAPAWPQQQLQHHFSAGNAFTQGPRTPLPMRPQ